MKWKLNTTAIAAALCVLNSYAVAPVGAVEAKWAAFCDGYATRAVDSVTKSREMKCAGHEGPRWDRSREAHFNWCIAQEGLPHASAEELHRIRELKECKPVKQIGKVKVPPPADAPAPAANTCTVNKPSAVYDAPEGNEIGELEKDTQGVTMLGKQGNDWYNVKWPAGQGWAFSGPGYEDALNCP